MKIQHWLVCGLLAATLTGCGTSQQTTTQTSQATENQAQTQSHQDHQMANDTGQKQEMPYDAHFLDMMMHHHHGAIAMAKEELAKGKLDQAKQMAQNIVTDQEAEIEHMATLRKQWYPDIPPMPQDQLDKMMGHYDLSEGQGSFDKRFLSAMIDHHQEALKMADEALSKAQHGELKTMAQEMKAKQQKEIAQMKQMEEMARR